MSANDFKEYLAEIGLNNTQVSQVIEYTKWDIQKLDKIKDESIGAQQLTELFSKLKALSISNVVFCPYIVRGLAYYTGTVIELYDIGQKDTLGQCLERKI
jgi:histidyl-tRNA synthetase